MTPSDFKAWFQGFTEALDGTPSEDQWKRIKARVAEIDGRPITEHVYIDRYIAPYRHYYYGTPWYGAVGVGASAGGINLNCSNASAATYTPGTQSIPTPSFNSYDAMLALGRAEASLSN